MDDGSLSYEFEGDEIYCYPNSNVLINKLGITEPDEFLLMEREITSITIQEILEFPIEGAFNFQHLKAVHKAIFTDLFHWAGEIRTVNISKGAAFCAAKHIENYAAEIFYQLDSEKLLMNLKTNQMVERMAYFYSEINALHPFREGNGRTQRVFFKYLAGKAGRTLRFADVSSEEMMSASINSFNGNLQPLQELFHRILSTD